MNPINLGLNTKAFVIVMAILSIIAMSIYLRHAERMKEMEYVQPQKGKW